MPLSSRQSRSCSWTWPGRTGPRSPSATALIGLAITAGLVILVGGSGTTAQFAFGGTYEVDALTTFLQLLLIGVVALSIVFGPDYLGPRNLPTAEFATVLVFALTGAMLIAASADLLILFIALELMVLPGYLLAAYHKTDAYSTEGAIKYFLLGSFSSAIFLFGLAFVWGMTGTTSTAGRGRGAQRDRGRVERAVAGAGDGPRADDDRRRVQDRRGAVPLLDAGRLPGLADAGHRLPVGRARRSAHSR